ncbi:MAG TPA: sugar ABC transporter permease [Tepidisphaeraceae bacterium]|nr:sugar ABC transporter permease [Tepidisphaeraceae bacterium]
MSASAFSHKPHTGRQAASATSRRSFPLTPYLFLTPYFLLTIVFFLYPLFYATILSFYQTNGPTRKVFVGLANFRFILSDPDFHIALRNTLLYTILSVTTQVPVALALALLLNARRDKLKSFFRLAVFAPNLVGSIFVGILFSVLFVPRYGLVNRTLQSLTHHGLLIAWLNEPSLIMPALLLASLWMYVGFNMIYFLAALQSIDASLIEAARIDGATPIKVFWHVTLPSIRPVTTFVVVMGTIGSLQLFELPYAMLRGFGPKNAALTIVGYLYQYAFQSGDLGTGAAVGWILTLLILGASLLQLRFLNRGQS